MGIARFIRSMAIFLALFMALLTCVVLFTGWLLGRSSFTLPDKVNTLILGDSHVECGLDDSILTGTANVSQSGEAYLYAYAKACLLYTSRCV